MIGLMARQDDTRQESGKVSVYARVDAETLAELDRLAEERRPSATRSQMIDLAVQEFIERHSKGKRKG